MISDENSSDATNQSVKNIEREKHYAIYYDDTWYLGRLIEQMGSSSKIKFLQSKLEAFVWPKREDIQIIDNNFIFYGPINMVGSYPLHITRHDRLTIIKKYKEFKHNR